MVASAYSAYDTKLCHNELRRKNQYAHPATSYGRVTGRWSMRTEITPGLVEAHGE